LQFEAFAKCTVVSHKQKQVYQMK